MQSGQRNQCLTQLINKRNADRAEYFRPGLCLELFGSVNISVTESESFLIDHKTQNDIPHKRIFVHMVTFFKCVSIQKDIPVHGMPDQIDIAMGTRAFCICTVTALFTKKSTTLSPWTKEKGPKIPGKVRTEPELPSSGSSRHHGSQATADVADHIELNLFSLSGTKNPPFFVEDKVKDNLVLELMAPSLGLCTPVKAVDKPLRLGSHRTGADDPQQEFKSVHGSISFSVHGQRKIEYARIWAVILDEVLPLDFIGCVDVLSER